MPELVLLTFVRAEFEALRSAAAAGDEEALKRINNLFDGYQDAEIACFLCDKVAERPPFAMMLPEPDDPAKLVALPLCPSCRDLPRMVRLNRAMRMARKVWSKPNRQLHYSFAPRR